MWSGIFIIYFHMDNSPKKISTYSVGKTHVTSIDQTSRHHQRFLLLYTQPYCRPRSPKRTYTLAQKLDQLFMRRWHGRHCSRSIVERLGLLLLLLLLCPLGLG